jgi:hypothetical protein
VWTPGHGQIGKQGSRLLRWWQLRFGTLAQHGEIAQDGDVQFLFSAHDLNA